MKLLGGTLLTYPLLLAQAQVNGASRDIDCEAIGGWEGEAGYRLRSNRWGEGENDRRGGWVEIVEDLWIDLA